MIAQINTTDTKTLVDSILYMTDIQSDIQKIFKSTSAALDRVNNYTRPQLLAARKKVGLRGRPGTTVTIRQELRSYIDDKRKRAMEQARSRRPRLAPVWPRVSDEDLEDIYEDLDIIPKRRGNVGDILSYNDVISGRLPNTYPYYVQSLRVPRPAAVLMTSDADVARYLRDVKHFDPRGEAGVLTSPARSDDYDGPGHPDSDRIPFDESEFGIRHFDIDDSVAGAADSPMRGGAAVAISGCGSAGWGGVAKAKVENCLINIIRMHDIKVNKVYTRFPHLKPVAGSRDDIFITLDEVEEVSKLLKITINIYTALGYRIGKPMKEYPYYKNKALDIIFENEHAYLAQKRMAIDRVVYGPLPDIRDIEGLVVAHEYYAAGDIPKYYTVLHQGQYTMLKNYRPSELTKAAADDSAKSNYYIFSNSQFVFKKFKEDHDLRTIKEDDMRTIVKASEHFIGRALMAEVTQDIKILDHNKNYVAYKHCPYYMGFPGNDFAASRQPQTAGSPYTDVFVALTAIAGAPVHFNRLFKYDGGAIILPIPVFKYLADVGCIMDVDYYVASTTKDIDIVNYVNKMGLPSESDVKLTRNMIIGRCIGGGLKEQKKMLIKCANELERNQIIFECHQNNIRFAPQEDPMMIEVRYKRKSQALYQFHSYILGYAAIHLLQKFDELSAQNVTIAGYNVDSIFYYGDYDASERPTEIGGWKYEKLAAKPQLLELAVQAEPTMVHRPKPQPKTLDGFRYTKNTLIIGPPGIGKSHDLKVRPLYDQIITTPTRHLREEHKAGEHGFANTFTTAKYIQFGMEEGSLKGMRKIGKAPRLHKTHVVDEFTMFNQGQWRTIIERSGDARIIAVGDFEQIRNSIDSPAVTIDFFVDYGFDVVYLNREEGKPARHTYEDGVILDSLRDDDTPTDDTDPLAIDMDDGGATDKKDQVAILRPHVRTIKSVIDEIPKMISADAYNMFVSDCHSKLNQVNTAAREYCRATNILFPCRDNKGGIVRLNVDDPLIWWGRVKMTSVRPHECKYEPAFAVTGDSIQGSTIENDLYVDDKIKRQGVFYTTVTRTRSLKNIILVESILPINSTGYPLIGQYDDDSAKVAAADDDTNKMINDEFGDLFEAVPTPAPADVAAPIAYQSLSDILAVNGFVIHTEYPHRHFLKFTDPDHFLAWSATQPEDQRCYHEVVSGPLRKLVVDIDGKGIAREDWPKMDRLFADTFARVFKSVYTAPMNGNEAVLVGSSGFSVVGQADKYSLQIRTAQYVTNRESCKAFAHKYVDELGNNGKYVDLGIYKKIQNFRCVGSTKLGDARHSQILNGHPTIHSFVGQIAIVPTELKPLAEPVKYENPVIQDEHTQKIITAAAPFTAGLTYKFYNGQHTFRRVTASYCQICDRSHESDNMFVTLDRVTSAAGEVRLRCRGGHQYDSTKYIALFAIDMLAEEPKCLSDEAEPSPKVDVPAAEFSSDLRRRDHPRWPFSNGPLVDHPKKRGPMSNKTRISILKSKIDYIAKLKLHSVFFGEDFEYPDPKTFAEAECWRLFESIYEDNKDALSKLKEHAKFIKGQFAKRYVAMNIENRKINVSNPAPLVAYKILYKAAMRMIKNPRSITMAIIFSGRRMHEYVCGILDEISTLSGHIMSVDQAKKIWGDILAAEVKVDPLAAVEVIEDLNI